MTADTGAPAGVHLVGGGIEGLPSGALGPFVDDVARHADADRGRPRLLLVMANDAGMAPAFRPTYVHHLDTLADDGFDYVDVGLDHAAPLPPRAVQGVDGIVVAGGATPVYRRGLAPAAAAVREAVARGVPYLGFSAGAMVAAARALVGGWRDGGRAVCDQDWSEGLADLTVEAGLGLVDVTVDVHASQGGLLGRAVAVAQQPGSPRVVAVDEGTCLTVPLGWRFGDDWQLFGSGFAWLVEQKERETVVRRLPA